MALVQLIPLAHDVARMQLPLAPQHVRHMRAPLLPGPGQCRIDWAPDLIVVVVVVLVVGLDQRHPDVAGVVEEADDVDVFATLVLGLHLDAVVVWKE